MRELTEEEKQQIWKEVKEDFPDDEMMQEIHYTRMKLYFLTKDLSSEERIKFFNSAVIASKS
ncbi:MAG: hypothetical protein ABRQ38_07030 [Candidatus Eremiobacterota bacterium]